MWRGTSDMARHAASGSPRRIRRPSRTPPRPRGAAAADRLARAVDHGVARRAGRRGEARRARAVLLPARRRRAAPAAADVLAACGLANVFLEARYPRPSLAELAARKPELVVLPGEPYPWTEGEADELVRELAALGTRARAVRVPGEALTWWGTR